MIWPASLAFAKPVGMAVTALLLGFPFIASGQLPFAALTEMAERPLEKALQIEYQLTAILEPRKFDQGGVDRKVEEFRQELLASNAAGRDELVENYRKSLERKTAQKLDGLFVLGKEFIATYADYLPGSPAGATWEIRQGTNKYTLVENETLPVVHDPEARSRGEQDVARRSIGRLGQLDPEILQELTEGKVETFDTEQGMTVKKGNLTVKLSREGEKFRLYSIERLEPGHRQRIALIFEDYRNISGISVPTKVTDLHEDRTSRCTRTYHVKSVRFGDEYAVPLVNRDIGLLSVTDFRFSPKIQYLASRRLPVDIQIAEWAANPEALREHNAAMAKIRN
jgi:hypothetical protein